MLGDDIEFDEFDDMNNGSERSLLVDSKHNNTQQATYSADTVQDEQSSGEGECGVFVVVLSLFAAIGGFLFGYDTGVVSGAMLLLTEKFALSSLWQEVIVSATIFFAAVFALVGGILNDRFGRKFVTIVASFVFTFGALILSLAQNIAMLVIGRSVLGVGIGLASMTVPVYIAECAPPDKRGRFVTMNNVFITGGQFIASVVNGAFSYDMENGWRWMFGLAGVPSVIQLIGFIFLPESPRWLIKKGKTEAAKTILGKMRNSKDVDEEISAIEQSSLEDKQRMAVQGKSMVLIKIMKTPATRRAVIVGCSLQLFQQLSGINTVMYYSATIVKMTGVRDVSTAIWIAAGTAGVNFVFTFVGLWLVGCIGRRSLTIGSLIGVLVSLAVLAVGFQLAAFNSPPVTVNETSAESSSCYKNSYASCQKCIENLDCGFCYQEVGGDADNGSCLPILSKYHTDHSDVGRCSNMSGNSGLLFAYQYCPTDYYWIGILGLVMYLMFFAPGMGPMPWTINSEIYPLWARSTGNALATATNWIFNLIVSMTFLTLTESITKYGTYWLLCGIVIVGIIFISLTLPETKGKRLEEVEKMFEKPWSPCGCMKQSLSETGLIND